MNRPARIGRIALWAALTAGGTAAQGTVWVVAQDPGPGVDFTSVQPAVDAAADGDVVLIHPGTYSSATVDGKGLSLVAEEAGTVYVRLVVRNSSASQDVFVRGIDASGSPALTIESCAGDVLVEDGSFATPPPVFPFEAPGASVTSCASVVFVRCSFRGSGGFFQDSAPILDGGDGITATSSFVHFYECTAQGGHGAQLQMSLGGGSDGGNGATLASCSFFASGTTFQGGDGGLSNCSAAFPGDGGAGLVTTGPVGLERFELGCTFAGGDPGKFFTGLPFCPNSLPGVPVSGVVSSLPGQPRTMFAGSPVREGELSTSVYVGQPGDLVFGIWGVKQSHVFYQVFKGTTVPQVLAAVLLGTIPASGTLSFSLPLGNLPPGADSLSLYSQAVVLPTSAPLQLTNATGVVILDESF